MLQKSEVYLLIIVASILFLLVAFFLIMFVFYFLKKKKQVLLEKELLEKSFAQILLQSRLEIQEQTLQHIGRELHDNLGQQASLIKIHLNTLQLADTVKATEKIEDTKNLTRQLIADLKTLSVSLGGDRIAQAGFARALESEVDRLNKTGQFNATYTQNVHFQLSNDKAVILYRMAQEVLNNIIKHSGAKNITVDLMVTENDITLVLRDDGCGFQVAERVNSGGAGLRNLQSRAQLLPAHLDIQSAAGSGTVVTIRLNLQ